MKIEYGEAKNRWNIEQRQLPFSDVIQFDWSTAQVEEDTRHDYPERRFVATGYIENRVHIICFALITDGVRIISFRKANKREVKRYEENTINR